MGTWDSYESATRAIEEASFEVVDFMRFNENSDIWNFIPHSHNFYELIFFLHGNAQISLDARSLYATFSDVVIYPPRQCHTEHLQISHRQEIYCLQCRVTGLDAPGVVHQQDRRQQIKSLLDGLFAEYGNDRDPDIMSRYLKLLSSILVRNHFRADSPTHPIDYCMMYMRHNLARPITIEALSELIHVSRSHMNKLFVQRTGMTPMRYLLDIRIDAAKSLLMTTRRPVAAIAADVGFNSPKHFCHTFHRATGMSPREFRNAEGLEAFTRAARQ